MTTSEHITLQQIIKDSLEQSVSYQEYRTLVNTLVLDNSTSGAEITEALIAYTKLNDRRMKRWDKTVKVSESVQQKIKNYNKKVTWLVLTESWCGDAAHVIPVLNKIAELSEYIDLKLVFRDENEELINQFLTHGGKGIPKLIMIDTNTHEIIDTYGPRPSEATTLVNNYKAQHGNLTPEFKEDLQHWYNKDKGQTTIKDVLQLLEV